MTTLECEKYILINLGISNLSSSAKLVIKNGVIHCCDLPLL